MDSQTEKLQTKHTVTLASGQAVTITCPIEDLTTITDALALVAKIEVTPNAKTTLWHGKSPVYSRFDIEQIYYQEYSWGYVEILNVKDGPDDKPGVILHERLRGGGRTFSYWKTVTNAQYMADQPCWPTSGTTESFQRAVGFISLVKCDGLVPWFLAVGDEQLIGEFTFPKKHFEHPVFRPGQHFVVYDLKNPSKPRPMVKMCVCCKMEKVFPQAPDFTEYQTVIYWHDGTRSTEYAMRDLPPIPFDEKDLWLVQAQAGLGNLVVTPNTEIVVSFTDGTAFYGKIRNANHPLLKQAGLYGLTAKVKGQELPEHWQKKFEPSTERPTILDYAVFRLKNKGLDPIWIQVREVTPPNGERRILGGIYYYPTF